MCSLDNIGDKNSTNAICRLIVRVNKTIFDYKYQLETNTKRFVQPEYDFHIMDYDNNLKRLNRI